MFEGKSIFYRRGGRIEPGGNAQPSLESESLLVLFCKVDRPGSLPVLMAHCDAYIFPEKQHFTA